MVLCQEAYYEKKVKPNGSHPLAFFHDQISVMSDCNKCIWYLYQIVKQSTLNMY